MVVVSRFGSAARAPRAGSMPAPPAKAALQTLRDNPYDKWREYDPEDTLRFYALRMREAGFVKSSPQKIIADGTDWRFFNEIRRELKA